MVDRGRSSALALVAIPPTVPPGVHLSPAWEDFVFGCVLGPLFWGGWVALFGAILKSVRWTPGLSVFMMDYERSWVFGLSGDTSGGPPWVRISASHVFGVWFVLQTICEGCNSLPVTDLRPFYVKRK